VAIAERIAERLRRRDDVFVTIEHRDVQRGTSA
jgi:RNase adaptor protein for sRNA GlmZ degradation